MKMFSLGKFHSTARHNLTRALFILIMVFALTVEARSAEYYISPGGSDANSATEARPVRTVPVLFSRGASGDTFIFMDGTYDYEDSNINNPPSGTAGAYTLVRAQNDGKAIIDGAGTRTPIWIHGAKYYIRIMGFYCKESNQDVVIVSGTDDSNMAHHIEIKRVSGRNAGGTS